MKVTPKKFRKFQEGGEMMAEPMPTEGAAPEEQAPALGGGDPLMLIAQLAAQALLNQDCEAAMQVCLAFVEMILQAQGGGGAPAEGQPVFRKGGKLAYRI